MIGALLCVVLSCAVGIIGFPMNKTSSGLNGSILNSIGPPSILTWQHSYTTIGPDTVIHPPDEAVIDENALNIIWPDKPEQEDVAEIKLMGSHPADFTNMTDNCSGNNSTGTNTTNCEDRFFTANGFRKVWGINGEQPKNHASIKHVISCFLVITVTGLINQIMYLNY